MGKCCVAAVCAGLSLGGTRCEVEDGSSPATDPAAGCAVVCGKAVACWPDDVEPRACREECVEDLGRLTGAGARAERRCWERLTCAELQRRSAWASCIGDALEAGELGRAAEELCAAQVALCRRCLGATCPAETLRDECLAIAPAYTEAHQRAVARCFESSACARDGACLELLRYPLGE